MQTLRLRTGRCTGIFEFRNSGYVGTKIKIELIHRLSIESFVNCGRGAYDFTWYHITKHMFYIQLNEINLHKKFNVKV